MKTSENIKEIATALKNFQEVAVNAFKGKKGYGYNYAPLDVILKDNRPLMAKFGLSHIQSETFENNIVTVATRVMHESGEWIETTAQSPYATLKGMNDYQAIGSGITYLRRYGLSAALGIASDEDQDAHGEQTQKESPNKIFVRMCKDSSVDPKLMSEKLGVSSAKPETVINAINNQEQFYNAVKEVRGGN